MSGDDRSARALTVVIHDVAPATRPLCQALLDAIAGVAQLPLTLLIVPRYHGAARDPGFEHWLDRAVERGDELALHGLTHCDDGTPSDFFDWLRRRWYTAG